MQLLNGIISNDLE